MTSPDLSSAWPALRDRLAGRGLLAGDGAGVSLRQPGAAAMWIGRAGDASPRRVALDAAAGPDRVHAAVYAARADAGAVAVGGGHYGRSLLPFGGALPQVFDEQARHLGPMSAAANDVDALAGSLHRGGNVGLLAGQPVCVGTTATRLALNAELFEKCATACVLAMAAGGRVRPLPWWVRWVANGRLRRDAERAAARFAAGLLPEESRGY